MLDLPDILKKYLNSQVYFLLQSMIEKHKVNL